MPVNGSLAYRGVFTMTTTTARTARTARTSAQAAIAPIAAAYVGANVALLVAIARIDKLDDAHVSANSPAARQAVAAWDKAYLALEAARQTYEWEFEALGFGSEYELELYAGWDWDMPEDYIRLSRV